MLVRAAPRNSRDPASSWLRSSALGALLTPTRKSGGSRFVACASPSGRPSRRRCAARAATVLEGGANSHDEEKVLPAAAGAITSSVHVGAAGVAMNTDIGTEKDFLCPMRALAVTALPSLPSTGSEGSAGSMVAPDLGDWQMRTRLRLPPLPNVFEVRTFWWLG